MCGKKNTTGKNLLQFLYMQQWFIVLVSLFFFLKNIDSTKYVRGKSQVFTQDTGGLHVYVWEKGQNLHLDAAEQVVQGAAIPEEICGAV